MGIRVVQWGSGNVGRSAIATVAARPGLEVAGLLVSNPDKVGRDAGTIAGIEPLGVIATDDTSIALADVTGDGLPDIFESNYVDDERVYEPIRYGGDGKPIVLPGPKHFNAAVVSSAVLPCKGKPSNQPVARSPNTTAAWRIAPPPICDSPLALLPSKNIAKQASTSASAWTVPPPTMARTS